MDTEVCSTIEAFLPSRSPSSSRIFPSGTPRQVGNREAIRRRLEDELHKAKVEEVPKNQTAVQSWQKRKEEKKEVKTQLRKEEMKQRNRRSHARSRPACRRPSSSVNVVRCGDG